MKTFKFNQLFYKSLPVLFFIVLLGLVTTFCVASEPAHNGVRFQLFVNGGTPDYQEFKSTNKSGYTPQTLIWINHNPVNFYSGTSCALEINHWLKFGTNIISITGSCQNPLKLQVQSLTKDFSESIVFEKTITNINTQLDQDKADSFEFVVNNDFHLPIYLARNELPEKRLIALEVQHFLVHIGNLVQDENRSTNGLVDLLLSGSSIWVDAYGTSSNDFLLNKKYAEKYWSDTNRKFRSINLNETKFVVGKSTVLAYTSNTIPVPHFISEVYFGKTNYLPVLRLAKIDGKWIVWQ